MGTIAPIETVGSLDESGRLAVSDGESQLARCNVFQERGNRTPLAICSQWKSTPSTYILGTIVPIETVGSLDENRKPAVSDGAGQLARFNVFQEIKGIEHHLATCSQWGIPVKGLTKNGEVLVRPLAERGCSRCGLKHLLHVTM